MSYELNELINLNLIKLNLSLTEEIHKILCKIKININEKHILMITTIKLGE